MIRYKVSGSTWEDGDAKDFVIKGWVQGHDLTSAAATIEKYYGLDLDSVTFKYFENYDLDLIEDDYLSSEEDIE